MQGPRALPTPRSAGAIRQLPGRGIRARAAAKWPDGRQWKYVHVRCRLRYPSESIRRGLQWVLFEPNDERLWERVRQTVRSFPRPQWRAGALAGIKPEDAFFVAVGRETMTADDIRDGRLIIEIGVAPLRPAEFMVLRISRLMRRDRRCRPA